MVRPVPASIPITLGYRQKMRSRPSYIHRGIDFGCPTGTKVVATRGGTVVYAGRGGGYGPAYGIHVVVRVGSTWCLYAHLSAEIVSVGQIVTTGQQVGRSGATGNVTGPHLHYQECTKPPGAYTSDRAPQFIDWTDGPTDPKLNPANYGPGNVNSYVTAYGKALVKKGFGKHYEYGPGPRWSSADELNTRDFQLSRPELRGDADGLPGPLTLRLAFS